MRFVTNKILFSALPVLLAARLIFAATSCKADVSFKNDIAPILLKRCTGCHGERANLGTYRAQTYQNLMKAGASGLAAVVPGKPTESTLFQRIITRVEPIRMPKSDDPLTSEQIETVRKWILAGAKYDGKDVTTPLKNLLGVRAQPIAPTAYRTVMPITALAFTPGGKEIAVGGYHEITFWNAQTGALVRRLPHLPQRIQALHYSKDGKTLLLAGGTSGEYGEVALLDAQTGARTALQDTFDDIVLAAAFSPDGKTVAAGGADASVRLYEVATGKRLWNTKVHGDWVTSISFSFDGRFVASASKDMTVKVYEVANGSLFATYLGHNRQYGQYKGQAPVYAVAFLSNSLTACSAGGGRWLQLWDPIKTQQESGSAADQEDRFVKQGHERYIEHGFTKEVYGLIAQEGHVFASSADGMIKEFDVSTLKEVRAYKGHTDWVFALDADVSSHRLVSGAYNGEVRVWDTQTGQCLLTFKAMPGSSPAATLAQISTK